MLKVADQETAQTEEERIKAFHDRLDHLQSADKRHHLHPFTDPKVFDAAPPFVVDHASGCYVSGHGMKFLDAMSGLGCVNIGYGHPRMAEAAAQAIGELSYYHSFAAITTPAPALLAEKVASLLPDGFSKMFFANSGSEANETLLKLVRLYWHVQGKSSKRKIITREYAYHGSTIATAALNGQEGMREPFGIDMSDVVRVEAPFWYRQGGDMAAAEYGIKAARLIEDAIVREGADKIGAIFVEPIQGAGGAVMPPPTYFPELRRIADKHDVLLVIDEVMTGMGRTGDWTACETMGIDGDMIALSKGLSSGYMPISAAVIHDRVMDVLKSDMGVLQHGFTTGGHPVACTLALTNIDIIEQEGLIGRIKTSIGPYFERALRTLETHPLVGEVRTQGLIAGIELVKDKKTKQQFPAELQLDDQISQACLFKGLMIRPTGNTLVLYPPFVIEEGQINFIQNVLVQALDEVYQKLVAEKLI